MKTVTYNCEYCEDTGLCNIVFGGERQRFCTCPRGRARANLIYDAEDPFKAQGLLDRVNGEIPKHRAVVIAGGELKIWDLLQADGKRIYLGDLAEAMHVNFFCLVRIFSPFRKSWLTKQKAGKKP